MYKKSGYGTFLLAFFSLVCFLGFFQTTHAAISFVSSAAASSTSVTLGTHAANDIIFMVAVRNNATPCTLPSGWTEIASSTFSGLSSRFAYKVAASDSETSGTWTNCLRLVSTIYRGQSLTAPLGGFASSTGTSVTMTYPQVTMSNSGGTSWVLGSGYHATAVTTAGQVPPTGMTNRIETGAFSLRTGSHDTNGGTASWTDKTVTASGSGRWVTYVQELVSADNDTTPPVVGNSGTITTSNVYDTELTLNWTKATDNVSNQSTLQYRVYMSPTNNIDTVANIEANGTPLNSYTNDIATLPVSSLTANTTYYFNIIAKDTAENKSAYTMKSVTTQNTCSRNFLLDFSRGTNGSSLSASLLNSSTFGVSGSNWSINNASTNFAFSTDAYHILPGALPRLCENPWSGESGSLGGTLLIDNTLRYGKFTFPAVTADTITAGYWFKSDYPASQTGVNIDSFDIMGDDGSSNDFINVPFQVSNGSLKIGIETASGGGCSNASSLTNISSNTWYWITLQYTSLTDGSRGMRMSVYDEDLDLVAQLPSNESRTPCNPQKATELKFGHFSVTSSFNLPGSHLYYDKILVCYREEDNCAFPLLPTTSSPSVTTSLPTSVTDSSALLNGSITATGGVDSTESGFAYGTVSDLSTVIATTTLGVQTGTASFTSTITNLTPHTLYYFRAYATNSQGTSFGSILSTTTLSVSSSPSPTPTPTATPAALPIVSVGTQSGTVQSRIFNLLAMGSYSLAQALVAQYNTPISNTTNLPTLFSQALKSGTSSKEVQALQSFLNTHGFIVALEGAGSIGHETMYFGSLTRAAVIKFQEYYQSEILAPFGLTRGTGYVGSLTLRKINHILSNNP